MAQNRRELTVSANDDGRRLDKVARLLLPRATLSAIYRAIRSGDIRVDGAKATQETRLRQGQVIEFRGPLVAGLEARRLPKSPPKRLQGGTQETPQDSLKGRAPDQTIDLSGRILYEDNHILAVNKRAGELTHGEGSLAEAVDAYLAGRIDPGLSFRPGPIHRLDRNTSGVILFSVSLAGAQAGAQAFRTGKIRKRYVALLEGTLSEPATWNEPLRRDSVRHVTVAADERENGLSAVTRIVPIAPGTAWSVCIVEIATGRTHQIRAHAAIHGHPLLGDRKYGSESTHSMLLHCGALTVTGDCPGLEFGHLSAPLPDRLERVVTGRFGPEVADRITDILAARE